MPLWTSHIGFIFKFGKWQGFVDTKLDKHEQDIKELKQDHKDSFKSEILALISKKT